MTLFSTLQTVAFSTILAALTACGGSSDGGKDSTPTGGALPSVWFADSDGYYPLDKLKSNGSFYSGREADFGPQNPAFKTGDKQNSHWAIDTSANIDDGSTLSYAMEISGVNVSKEAIDNLKNNLRINTQTGLITQYCQGFPNCYDNITSSEENFLITVTATVVGSKSQLQREFLFKVRANR